MANLRTETTFILTLSSLLLLSVKAGLDEGACECQPGQNCDFKKWSGTGTECECECWDTEGKCTPGGWKKVDGEGNCDFEAGPGAAPPPLQPCECPPDMTCEFKSSGYGTECECECWDLNGKCTQEGWKKVAGTGTCDFEAGEVAPGPASREPCACPAGTSCDFQKFSGDGTECECECWESDGKCTNGGWKRIKGTGSCDFDADSAGPLRPCQCPPGLTCEFKKSTSSGTECECECWDTAGKCTIGGWKRTKGNGSCDFEAVAVAPKASPVDSCDCPIEATCEFFKISPSGTECKCNCWDSNGKCTPTGWKKTKGEGSCEFGVRGNP